MPFQQVAFAGAVDDVQLGDVGAATNADIQRLHSTQLYLQLTAQQAATQLDTHQGLDVGAHQLQVQVAAADLQVGAQWRERDVAAGLQLAGGVNAGIQ